MTDDLHEAMRSRVLVCDGDVGAVCLQRGAPARTAAEAAVTDPARLIALYAEYRQAGADILQTNTALASAAHLELLGSALQPADVWSAAVRLCKGVAAGGFVAAVVGPPPAGAGTWSEADLGVLYRRQLEVLVECAPDLLLFRGFGEIGHLRAAIGAVPPCASPMAATLGAEVHLSAADAQSLCRGMAQTAGEFGLMAVGAGGEAAALQPVLRGLREACELPLVAQWAQGPSGQAGRQAAGLIAVGARIVGGAAGMSPTEVTLIARAARALA